jgi:uncharacterized damage-inducible protein DinB
VDAAAEVDAAFGRLSDALAGISDGDLHRAHSAACTSVAGVVSHTNVCTIIWLGDMLRLINDPDLRFFYCEEIGHDSPKRSRWRRPSRAGRSRSSWSRERRTRL